MFVSTEHSELPSTFQTSLFGGGAPAADPRFRTSARSWLDDDSWVDIVPGWLAGADSLFNHLADTLPWSQRTVPMYERLVDEPRLVYSWSDDMAPEDRSAVNVSVLHEMRLLVSVRYGNVFDSFGCNLYRSGRDSVAWHRDRYPGDRYPGDRYPGDRYPGDRYPGDRYPGDRMGSVEDPTIAVLTLGGTRPFQVRPRGGGRSLSFLPASGDLLVLGGRANHDWEHCVPKVHRADPRISVAFRHDSAVRSREQRSPGRLRPVLTDVSAQSSPTCNESNISTRDDFFGVRASARSTKIERGPV
jgi:alkylated DNA repair dioxygenase AlkB